MTTLDSLILVYSHVHVQDSSDLSCFVDSAFSNFDVEPARRGNTEGLEVLALATGVNVKDSAWLGEIIEIVWAEQYSRRLNCLCL